MLLSRLIFSTALLALVAAAPIDRAHEGDWYISDTTDNVTGEREVYAMQSDFDDGKYVTVRMRCNEGKPTLYVEWMDLQTPDHVVLTIASGASPDAEPIEGQYIFDKSSDPINHGLRASPEVSQQIVAAVGKSAYMIITPQLASRTQSANIESAGTQPAWQRVARHCPVKVMPLPPM